MNRQSDKTTATEAISWLVLAIVSSYMCGTCVTQALISPVPPTTLWLAGANGALAMVTFIRVLLALKKSN